MNDTSGKASLSDQLIAYDLISNLWTSGPTGGDRVSVIDSFSKSAFTQKVQAADVSYSNASFVGHETSGTAEQQKTIDAFNGLSSTDQQIIVNQQNNSSQNGPYGSGGTAFSSVDSYKANLQARLGVISAFENAVSAGAYKLGTDPSAISDKTLSAVIKLSQSQNQNNDQWTAQAQAALNALTAANNKSPVTVTLSAEAKAALSVKSSGQSQPVQTSPLTGSDIALELLGSKGAPASLGAMSRSQSKSAAKASYIEGSIVDKQA